MNKLFVLKGNTDAYAFLCNLAAEKCNNTEIAKDGNGKPFFKFLPDFYFNISHTDGLTVIAVSESEVGVDVEKLRKADLRIAKRRFLKCEAEYIKSAKSDRRFFEVWTKKEAYLKYKGTGLAGGLDSVNVFECIPEIKTFYFEDYIISICCENELKIEK